MANKYYGRLDNGTNPQAVMYPEEKHSVPKSYFDLSHIVTQTQTLGGLYPFFLLRTVPNDNFEIGVDLLVTVTNPFIRRMLSTLNITTHFYYDRMSHIWEGGKNHFTKGRTGNIVITFPKFLYHHSTTSGSVSRNFPILAYDAFSPTMKSLPSSGTHKQILLDFDCQMSLACYLGLTPAVYTSSYKNTTLTLNYETDLPDGQFCHYHGLAQIYLDTSGTPYREPDFTYYPTVTSGINTSFVNALPFAMYQKVYAENYAPKNLLVNNKYWYPDNPDDFILPYNSGGVEVSCMSRQYPNGHIVSGSDTYSVVSTVPLGSISDPSSVTDNYGAPVDYDDPALGCLRFRQWQGDYFTAAVPWIVRGDMYQIDFSDLGLIPVKPYTNGSSTVDSGIRSNSDGAIVLSGSSDSGASYTSPVGGVYPISTSDNPVTGGIALYADASGTKYGLSANMIYELLALSRWQERNTRTDGDYNSLIKAHFNFDPKSEDWHSVYIGGSFTRMQFSEVLQTNQDSSSTTPLGSQVSRGVANQSGYIGRFTSPDFGYIMGICSIIPNTFYTQGLSRQLWWNTTNEDECYPEFNNMAPQAILNKEIFFSSRTISPNDDVFAYTERYADYKFMPNRVAGSFTAPASVNLEWSAYSYARYFTSTPSFNSKFVTCYGFRRDMWSTPLLPEFIVQIAVKCDAIRPIPYDSIPGGNINV